MRIVKTLFGRVKRAFPIGCALGGLLTMSSCEPERDSASSALARTDAASARFADTMRLRLASTLARDGAEAAMDVCSTEAPRVRREVQEATGVRLGYASLRRQAPGEPPPAWVNEWLEAQGERSATGLPTTWATTRTTNGQVARVIRPIAMEQACLVCHGGDAEVTPAVRAALARKYPRDVATGYRAGDLRGALWAELPAPAR
jgi:hypothetical protein